MDSTSALIPFPAIDTPPAVATGSTAVRRPVHHVLIDHENIAVADLTPLAGTDTQIHLILGPGAARTPVDLLLFKQKHPGQLRVLQCPVAGRNALDLVLIFELGLILGRDPAATCHILSRDHGYQSVIQHTAASHRIRRHECLQEIRLAVDPTPLDRFRANLLAHPGQRPKTRPKLENALRTALRLPPDSPEIARTIARLTQEKLLRVTAEGKVVYPALQEKIG